MSESRYCQYCGAAVLRRPHTYKCPEFVKLESQPVVITDELIRECNRYRQENWCTLRDWCDTKGYDVDEFHKALAEWNARK